MSDLSEQQWQEYLAKDRRSLILRAYMELRAAQASLLCADLPELRAEVALLGDKVEAALKERYGDLS
jgi:hypothetical protein